MPFHLRRVDYFHLSVPDEPGEGYSLLTRLAELGINLFAFAAVPLSAESTQLTLFPEDAAKLQQLGARSGLRLDGPYPAILAQGDDELGALANVHKTLQNANVNVFASHGVADGRGGYGYVIYVRPDEYIKAARALGI